MSAGRADDRSAAYADGAKRMRVVLRGAVQGVGFRPFVYRLARLLTLKGWVTNSPQGVTIEVEGETALLQEFLLRLDKEKPPRSFVQSLEHTFLDPARLREFAILESDEGGPPLAIVLPDIGTCPDCLAELFDPGNRRFRYPFINCTHCGPRFSIITALPYDRPNTSMAGFAMCAECRREYEDPMDRRFHAQPIACPACGPQLSLLNPGGDLMGGGEGALMQAADLVRRGGILALKGIGGFQLITDARNDRAVQVLRDRKGREEKPFAVMMPSPDMVLSMCDVSAMEERLLRSAEAPIVLLDRRPLKSGLAANLAPGNPTLGVMLPYSPLHHLLLTGLGFPVVATSGNLSDEPICIDDHEALRRLATIADLFLVHNRPIVRHVDDSIARVVAGRELLLRRARGYAPLPIRLRNAGSRKAIAVGAHLKNTVGLLTDGNAFISQHIGDLETGEAHTAFKNVAADLQRIYGPGEEVVCDLHPDYLSTVFARASALPLTAVQHHYAHVLACMAENELEGPLLGVSWDGTGWGSDGTIWGGEFLIAEGFSFRRAAALRRFRLPGGDRAVKEPRRTALGVLFEMFGDGAFDSAITEIPKSFLGAEARVLRKILASGFNAPTTSSAGRLFDAAAALTGIRMVNSFEGQAAMEMEYAARRSGCQEDLVLPLLQSPSNAEKPIQMGASNADFTIDWEPLFHQIIERRRRGVTQADLSALFHNTMVTSIVSVAQKVGLESVALTGGCFQSRVLTERTIIGLRRAGFKVYWHQRVPPNDGGIALGQLYAAVLKGRL